MDLNISIILLYICHTFSFYILILCYTIEGNSKNNKLFPNVINLIYNLQLNLNIIFENMIKIFSRVGLTGKKPTSEYISTLISMRLQLDFSNHPKFYVKLKRTIK